MIKSSINRNIPTTIFTLFGVSRAADQTNRLRTFLRTSVCICVKAVRAAKGGDVNVCRRFLKESESEIVFVKRLQSVNWLAYKCPDCGINKGLLPLLWFDWRNGGTLKKDLAWQWPLPAPLFPQRWTVTRAAVASTRSLLLAELHWFDPLLPPLARSWEVTKDETWLQAAPKSSNTWTPPGGLVAERRAFVCVRAVHARREFVRGGAVWDGAFMWDTMPNVLERMSGTLGCDVLLCWP